MRKGILITLPKSDEVTTYLSIFSKPIIDACFQKSINFKLLNNHEANKKNFELVLSKLNYKMVFFNGHGSANSICGYKNEELVRLGKNESILRERIIYARSCWSVSGLGRSCMKDSKEGCFIGYRIPFMFLINKTWIGNPIKDKTAKIFFETSNNVPLGFIKGHSAIESHENSKRSMLKAIKKLLRNKDKDSEAIAEILWNNYDGQVLLGNSKITF